LFLLFEKGKKERKKLLLYLCGASTTSSVKHVCIKYRKKELRSGIKKPKKKTRNFYPKDLKGKVSFFCLSLFFLTEKKFFCFLGKKRERKKTKK